MPRQEDRTSHLEEIELEFASGKRPARISDISMGGCYIDSIVSVPVGETVSLILKGPGTDGIRLSCTVAYVLDGFGFGVQFTDLSPDARQVLERIIGTEHQ